jgi:hypothetical protein
MWRCGLLLLLAAARAAAQDECRVTSPDGQLEFRLGNAQPEQGGLSRIAYQVLYRKQTLVDLSFLGLDVRDQEQMLGENLGLIGSQPGQTPTYHSLIAQYMQNGSLGRRLDVEVRVTDDGVAFRYEIPRSTPLERILVDDEVTEFDLGGGTAAGASIPMPLIVERPGIGWIAIAESQATPYPRAHLATMERNVLITRLPRQDALHPGFAGTTPMVGPWRVIAVGATRDSLAHAKIFSEIGSRLQ